MADNILIYGKDTWPYTKAAREAFNKQKKKVEYYDVRHDAGKLKDMLGYSGGVRKVPVIVDQDKVIIGFNGGTWGV